MTMLTASVCRLGFEADLNPAGIVWDEHWTANRIIESKEWSSTADADAV
jgi:hypothetical protein